MTYVIGVLFAAVFGVLSYLLGKLKAELNEREKESECVRRAELIRNTVVYNDSSAMSTDSFNRDNARGEE